MCRELLEAGLKIRQAYKKCRECSLQTESAQQLQGSSLIASLVLLLSGAAGRHSREFLLASLLGAIKTGLLVLLLSLWGLAWCDLFWWDAKCKGSHEHCVDLTHALSWEEHSWAKMKETSNGTSAPDECWLELQASDAQNRSLFGCGCSLLPYS